MLLWAASALLARAVRRDSQHIAGQVPCFFPGLQVFWFVGEAGEITGGEYWGMIEHHKGGVEE